MDTLQEIKNRLAEQDVAALKQVAARLEHEAQPSVVMHLLAPFLFRGDDEDTMSPEAALSVLGFLVHSKPSLYLKPASKAIRDEAVRLKQSPDAMVVSPDLMKAIIDQIASTDVQAASNATDAIVACCQKLGLAFAEPALVSIANHWQEALRRMSTDKASASTVAIRCATAVVDLGVIDEQMMKLVMDKDLMKLLLDMLNDDGDPLLQMSVLDLIEKMAEHRPMHQGLLAEWLFSNDVLTPLLQLAGGSDEEPDPILGGPALRVVAALCKLSQVGARVFESGASFLTGFHRALHNFEGSGELDRLAMIDAISSFAGASPDALELVLNDPVTREGWLSVNVSQSKLKAAILVSVAHVINPPPNRVEYRDNLSRLSQSDSLKLYSFVGRTNNQESTAMLLNFGKSPLPEIRLAAYALLEAVAKLPAGGQVLLSTANFIDFLLSREGEKTKEGREGRFAIVKAINESPVKGLLADEISSKIEKYVAEGPHYVKSIPWELATES